MTTTTFENVIEVPAIGTIGIGVGEYLDPIFSRGETEPVFHSKIWFPLEAREDAEEFAEYTGFALRENVPL